MQGSILIVEHDSATRQLLTGNFENAGYHVACASDFDEADSLVRMTRPDVALLEWAPGGPGLTYTRKLRCDQRTAPTSIIMLGSRAEEQDTIAALESGADDYLGKPVSMRELMARVKAVVRRRAPELAEAALELDGLRLDPAARRVTADEREVALRKTEYRLLHFFMTHPHRTFTRRELLDRLWGDHVFVEERTVDVHVRRLRRMLMPDHSAHVETVRGVGYRFSADPRPAAPPAWSPSGLASRAPASHVA